VTNKIRSLRSPLIKDGENWLKMGQLDEDWKVFGIWEFLGVGQRRGADVSLLKIGSRGELFCFGGILGFYADLRREFGWRNLDLMVFWFLGVCPRRSTEEGRHLCYSSVLWEEFLTSFGWVL
jgi:hypothetical protein